MQSVCCCSPSVATQFLVDVWNVSPAVATQFLVDIISCKDLGWGVVSVFHEDEGSVQGYSKVFWSVSPAVGLTVGIEKAGIFSFE